MAVVVDTRRDHQLHVAALLDELEERRRHISALQARGVRPAGLRDLKADLGDTRDRLAAVLGGEAA
jgi:hypothetical protein